MKCLNPTCGAEVPEGAAFCPACGEKVALVEGSGDTRTLFDLAAETVLLERFQLVRRVGSGGMGDVWLARDIVLDEQVACKILKPELIGDMRAVADMKREVALTRKLRHPNIVGVYDIHEDVGIHFITMEYVDGRSLSDALAEYGGPFPLEQVLACARRVARALDYAHSQGVLHRDVKPGNMLLGRDGNVKLADFGIARAAKDTQTRVTGEVSSGTLLYMSPEQLMGEKLDVRADLYSLAASVYELLAGDTPFHTGSIPTQIQLKAPSPIDGVPAHVNEALLTALDKQPTDRQANCAAFYKDLCGETARQKAEAQRREGEAEARRKDEEERAEEEGRRAKEIDGAREMERAKEARRQAEGREAPAKLVGSLGRRGKKLIVVAALTLVCLAAVSPWLWHYFKSETTRRSYDHAPRGESDPTDDILGRAAELLAVPLPEIHEGPDAGPLTVTRHESQGEPEAGTTSTVDLGGGVTLELVWVPPGTFMMGSPESEEGRDDDEVQHQVTLTKGFWLGKYEVTQAQWKAVMGNTVGQQRDRANKEWPLRGEGADYPIYYVSWDDCQAFIKRINAKGQGTFRLPTEAEWEYACRAGTQTPFYFGETISTEQANYDGDYTYGSGKKGVDRGKTTSVGSVRPNAWGLHDMHGNVLEWCQDWYGSYPSGSVTDPPGPSTGSYRVARGGCWSGSPRSCRSAIRSGRDPGTRSDLLGFRLARP